MTKAEEKEIDAILEAYHVATLQDMAGAAGLDVVVGKKKLPKGDLVKKMRGEFFTPERVQASLARLTAPERTVLDRLLLRGGSAPTRSFRREIIRAGLATEPPPPQKPERTGYYYAEGVPYARGQRVGNPHLAQSTIFEDVIARLTLHGLVFSRETDARNTLGASYKLQFHPANTLYIPQTIRRCLPEPQPIPIEDMPQPARARQGDPVVLLRDLYLYWDFARRNDVQLVQGGLVSKRARKAINEILLQPEPGLDDAKGKNGAGRLDMLRQMLEAFKLLQPVGGYLRPAHGDPLSIPEFWSWPQTQQVGACLEAWSCMGDLGELGGKGAQYAPQYPRARQAALNALKTLRPGVWYAPDELLEQISVADEDFLFVEHSRARSSRGGWYYSYSGGHYYGQAQDILKNFETLESEFVMACLTGLLHQLGLVELGYAQDETLTSFRLTPAGAAALTLAPPPESGPETGRLVIQPNFQLMAVGPVRLDTLARLDLFAERTRADRGAFEYRLSRESVYRAQQLGLDAVEVMRFLEQTGHAELPQNVRRSLEEWAAHHERIVFRTGVSLLQAASADLLTRLLESPRVGPLLARRVAPDVALLTAQGQTELIPALLEQGLLPAVSGAQPQSADKSVMVQEDGTVRAIHAVPSLHLRGRLARFAQETGRDGEWRLTPASISRAGGGKNKTLDILQELDRLHRGAVLPAKLVEQIKAWGGYYGDAAAQTLTLIEFRDQAALEELMQQPGLKDYLTPFAAGPRALAVAPPDKLAEIERSLAELGVRVKHGLK